MHAIMDKRTLVSQCHNSDAFQTQCTHTVALIAVLAQHACNGCKASSGKRLVARLIRLYHPVFDHDCNAVLELAKQRSWIDS